MLYNSYVTADGYASVITERYSQHGSSVSVISQAAGGTSVYVGTSPGFVGDTLVFNGTLTTPNVIIVQRSTLTRTDATHFARTFENILVRWTVSALEHGTMHARGGCAGANADSVARALAPAHDLSARHADRGWSRMSRMRRDDAAQS